MVNTKELYRQYFGSEDGKRRRWKVVHEMPKLSTDKKTILMRCWFPTPNAVVTVDVLALSSFFTPLQRIALSAFMFTNLEGVRNWAHAVSLAHLESLLKYANQAGDDPSKRTRAQNRKKQQLQEQQPSTFVSGYLYEEHKVDPEYKPEKLLIKNHFIPAQPVLYSETMMNDCLTLAVNQLLRHRFFITRDQVQRLV